MTGRFGAPVIWRLGLIPVLLLLAFGTAVARPAIPAHAATTLHDQLDHDGFNAIISTTSTSDPSLAAQAADDFMVPASTTWTLSEIDLCAVDDGANPATMNVVIYQDSGSGMPGTQVAAQANATFTRSTSPLCSPLTTDEFLYQINLNDLVAPAGHDWISVQANASISRWYWEFRSVVSNTQSMWQNPGDGSGAGCITWMATGTSPARGHSTSCSG